MNKKLERHARVALVCLIGAGGLPGLASAGPVVSSPFDLEIASVSSGASGTAYPGVNVKIRSSATIPVDVNGVAWTSRDYIEDSAIWVAPRYNYPAPLSPSVPADCTYARPGLCSYIWHDPADASNGTSGVNQAYFRTTFNLPLFQGAAFPFGAVLRVRADDDFAVWINGFLVMLDADFGKPGDLGPDHVFARDVSQFLDMDKLNVMTFVATDGSLFAPTDYLRLYEHLAFELKLNDIPEPASAALLLLGLGGLAGLRRRPAA